VNLNGIGITVSSHEIIEAFRNKEYAWLKEIIDESVEKALGMGCQLIGLGQFTSIITRNGTNLKLKEVGVTTGNSLTVASGTDVILSDLKTRKNNQHDRTLAVIGASGNVCEGYLKDLAPHFESIILVGSGRLESEEKLEKIAQRNFRFSRDKSNLKLTQDLKEIINADVIVSATSSTQAIIMPEHIKENALICDLAVPRDVHQRVYKERPDVKVIHGGVVGLPNRDETYLFALPFGAPGIVYACMAESILLGMRQMYDNFSYGDLTADKINHIREIFREEKFELVNKYA